MDQMPFLHRVAFYYAYNGFRGSQLIWFLAKFLQKAPQSALIQLPNKFPLIVNQKDWISRTIYEGTYERPLLHFLNTLVVSNLVIDVGANIGVTLWHGLRNSHPETKFLAFEPSSQCLPALRMSTSQLDRAGDVREYAIGDSDGTGVMHGIQNELHSGGASFISHSGLSGHSEEVIIRKLDTALAENYQGTAVSLLKIDTEGFEAKVINGAQILLKSGNTEIIIMEVSPNFGKVSYLTTVRDLIGDRYCWLTLEERGKLKRSPRLREISLEDSLIHGQQWNLVLIRKDIFDSYLNGAHPAFLKCLR